MQGANRCQEPLDPFDRLRDTVRLGALSNPALAGASKRPPQSKEPRPCRDSVPCRDGREDELWSACGLTQLFDRRHKSPCAAEDR